MLQLISKPKCGPLHFWGGKPWKAFKSLGKFIASGAICKEKTHMVRVNWPIIDRRLSMTEHFGRSFSNFLHFEWFKNVIVTPSQDLQIIFEMQSWQNSQKWVVKKIFFCIVKHVLFHFFFSLTPPTFKPHDFIISYSF